MKKFKKMLAALLTAAMMLSTVTVGFAATNNPAQDLNDLGLLLNVSEAELDAELTRAIGIAMIMKSLGYSQADADAKAEDCTFTDMDSHAWAKGFVALAYEMGITTGKVDGEIFDPAGTMTKKELVTFQLRALGYDTAIAWTKAEELGKAAGIATGIEDEKFVKSEAAEVMYAALNAEVQGEATSRKLIEKLVAEGVVDEAKAEAKNLVESELKVVSVESLNLKQFKVTFNKALDDEGDKSNYTVDDDASYLDGSDADFELSEDKKSVTVTMDTTIDNQEKVEIEIDNLKAINGSELEKTVQEVEFMDMTIPMVKSAEVVGKDTIKVIFSEPMTTASLEDTDNYEVEEGHTNVKSVTAQENNTEVLVELYSDLTDGTVEIKVSDVEDFAGYTAPSKTVEVTVTEDEDAPTIVGFKKAKLNSVTLIWSEDIEDAADELKDEVYHTNTSNTADTVTIDGKEMEVTFADGYEMPEGIAYIYVEKEAVTDLWDNDNDKQVIKINEIEVDNDAPQFVSYEVEDQTTVKLTFDEELSQDVSDLEVELLDKDGEKADNDFDSATVKMDSDDDYTVLSLTFDEYDDEGLYGDYTIVIEEGLFDTSDNEVEDLEVAVNFEDETAPDTTKFTATLYFDDDDKEMILVNFKDEMVKTGNYSPLNLKNWIIDGVNLEDIEDDVEIKFVDNNKAVEIEIDSDNDENLDVEDAEIIQLARVADAASNYTTAFSTNITIAAAGTVGIETAEIVDEKTVVVEFDDYLKTFDKDDISITTAAAIDVAKVSLSENSDGNTVATFTIDTDDAEFTANGLYNGATVNVKVVATDSENKYGETLALNAIKAATDKFKVAVAEAKDQNDDDVANIKATSATTIVITFTEAIDEHTVSNSTFEIDGGDLDVEGAVVNGNVLTLTIEADDDIETAADLVGKTVKQTSAIKDANDNKTTDIDAEVGEF